MNQVCYEQGNAKAFSEMRVGNLGSEEYRCSEHVILSSCFPSTFPGEGRAASRLRRSVRTSRSQVRVSPATLRRNLMAFQVVARGLL